MMLRSFIGTLGSRALARLRSNTRSTPQGAAPQAAAAPAALRARLRSATALPARFSRESEGAVSLETLFVIPFLLWAIAGTSVFYDAFRTRSQAQLAAQTVAEILSRAQENFTTNYIEGMNEVYDFVAGNRFPSRLRVSSVIWSSAENLPVLQWSYGTRGLPALPEETFELLAAQNYPGLLEAFGTDNGVDPVVASNQAPRPDLIDRIPPIMPGEAVLVVEAATMWSPFLEVGLTTVRFNQVVAVRPRFIEWIDLAGRNSPAPESGYEVSFTIDDPVVPDPPPPVDVPDTAPRTIVDTGFNDRADTQGWSHNTLTQHGSGASRGQYFGPFGGETLQNPVTLPVNFGAGPLASARISFDLLVIDSWDGLNQQYINEFGDTFFAAVDGTPIIWAPFNYHQNDFTVNDRTNTVHHNGSLYTTTMIRTSHNTNLYGSSSHKDTIWRVTIDIQAPPSSLTLGFLASLNEPLTNEAFGIDNLLITSQPGTPSPVGFTPNPAHVIGSDPHTGFRRYSGCPDIRLPANWLTVRASDTSQVIQFRRNAAAVNQRLDTTCSLPTSQFYASAAPHFVIDYNNQGMGGAANNLRLNTTTIGNASCNTALYVRGPNNQVWFNDNGVNMGTNSNINFVNPASGQYYVWVGQVNRNASCDTMVNIQRW